MDWEQALEIVVARTKHERYRTLCADDHPDREIHRARVTAKASGPAPSPAAYPSLFRQAANLAGAAGRVVAAAAKGEPVLASPEVRAERTAICAACEFHDAAKNRCTKCGCTGAKLHLAPMQCPLTPPRWKAVTTDR